MLLFVFRFIVRLSNALQTMRRACHKPRGIKAFETNGVNLFLCFFGWRKVKCFTRTHWNIEWTAERIFAPLELSFIDRDDAEICFALFHWDLALVYQMWKFFSKHSIDKQEPEWCTMVGDWNVILQYRLKKLKITCGWRNWQWHDKNGPKFRK